MDVIDLTHLEDGKDLGSVKRLKRIPPNEAQVIQKPRAPAPAGPDSHLGDEDLVITKSIGPVSEANLYFCLQLPRLPRYTQMLAMEAPATKRRCDYLHFTRF